MTFWPSDSRSAGGPPLVPGEPPTAAAEMIDGEPEDGITAASGMLLRSMLESCASRVWIETAAVTVTVVHALLGDSHTVYWIGAGSAVSLCWIAWAEQNSGGEPFTWISTGP
jgi:hypothetical protein